jgi:hypothetical protein
MTEAAFQEHGYQQTVQTPRNDEDATQGFMDSVLLVIQYKPLIATHGFRITN